MVMESMMERKWEAHTRFQDGFSRIVFEDGEEITVRNDGKNGIDFVEEYLEEMKKNYPSHLVAADQILQMRLGCSYKTIRNLRSRYLSELALVSLNCCFGREDEIPDHAGPEDFNTEHTHCPMRYNCPFNGFNPAFREKKEVCCNPVYECGLTHTQAVIADKLVNSSLSYEEIADEMGCSYSNIDNMRKRIFEKIGVNTRPELTHVLKGKRLL